MIGKKDVISARLESNRRSCSERQPRVRVRVYFFYHLFLCFFLLNVLLCFAYFIFFPPLCVLFYFVFFFRLFLCLMNYTGKQGSKRE
jgi:hypothetical protein